jgi:hypothetical protein
VLVALLEVVVLLRHHTAEDPLVLVVLLVPTGQELQGLHAAFVIQVVRGFDPDHRDGWASDWSGCLRAAIIPLIAYQPQERPLSTRAWSCTAKGPEPWWIQTIDRQLRQRAGLRPSFAW